MKYLNIKNRVSGLALSLALISLTLPSCKKNASKETSEQQAKEKTAVQVVKVEEKAISLSLNYTCLLEPKLSNKIMAQNGGRLQKLLVEVGSKVSKGQVLARLDETALKQAKIRLEEAKLNLNRIDELYKLGGIAKVQWEQAKNNYQIALEQHSNFATNTLLRSPINGIITAKNYNEGDLTNPKLPVLIVEQLSEIKAVINVSELYYSKIKEGQEANLHVEALNNESFKAKISKIYPTIDPKTHTFKVELLIPNKDGRLRTGMFAKLQLSLEPRNVLLISDLAIHKVTGSGSRYVYLLEEKDNKFVTRYQEIKLGELIGSNYEVLEGLKKGQKVIISATSNISKGEEVIVE